ncbi:MAG: hypothetical protein OWQ59_11750 [Alicyclobacillaceae bacterium]|nr:hypothetical protein [Alicyclobacillaceae bacterium]
MAWGAECDWPDDLERELWQMGVRASHIEVDLADPSEKLVADYVTRGG